MTTPIVAWSVSGWDWWIVLGGALQAGGASVLVVEVVRTFRRIESYRHKPQTVEVGVIDARAQVFAPTVVGGQPPTIDERLDRLEKVVGETHQRQEEQTARLEASARQLAEEAAGRAERQSERRFTAIELALLGDTPSDRRRRLVSIGAIVLGVILATLGSIGP